MSGSPHDRDVPVTIKDVAVHAGVALSSVSRVLSGHVDTSPTMRQRVELAAQELGYEVDLLAQSLRSGSTHTVGFVLRDISNPLFANIARRCEQELRRAGYSMLITSSDGDVGAEADNLGLLRRRRVDGVIASLVSETSCATRESLARFRVPVVLLDRQVDGLTASTVLCDHYPGVRRAVEELLACGHVRVAMVTGGLDVLTTRERRRGYLDAFSSTGIRVDDDMLVFGSFDADFAKGEVSRLLSRSPKPTALLTGGVGSTLGALGALRQLRLRPGKDVAMVALDDWPAFDALTPPLSSVARDSAEMGAVSARLLLDMLRGGEARIEHIETTFIPRDSLDGPLRGGRRASPDRAGGARAAASVRAGKRSR